MQHFAISAHRDGFRRAGRAWNREATTVAAGELTEEQLDQLQSDPNITVTPCAPEGPAAGGAGTASAGVAPSPQEVLRGLPVPELRAALIRAAMRGLDPDNPDHFTTSGAPEIAALKQATGLSSITAAERNTLWETERAEKA